MICAAGCDLTDRWSCAGLLGREIGLRAEISPVGGEWSPSWALRGMRQREMFQWREQMNLWREAGPGTRVWPNVNEWLLSDRVEFGACGQLVSFPPIPHRLCCSPCPRSTVNWGKGSFGFPEGMWYYACILMPGVFHNLHKTSCHVSF